MPSSGCGSSHRQCLRPVYRRERRRAVVPSPPELLAARSQLSSFVSGRAREAADRLGFGWKGTPNAPETYQQLRGAYARSVETGAPLPISNKYCDRTIFLTPEDNVRFRFWHDTSHVQLGLSFRLDDEWELACWHLHEATAAGFGERSLAHRLLRADTLGQLLVQSVANRFPSDQRRFALGCITQGMDAGILDELRRRV